MIREYLFEAVNREGVEEKDSVVAVDVSDARLQLSRMGYSDVRVLTDELVSFFTRACDGVLPALVIEAAYDSMPAALLKVFKGNWLLYLPGGLLIAEALWSGRTLYLGIGALLIGLGFVAFLSLPMVLYQQVLWARVRGHWASGLRNLAWLRRVNRGGISAMQLDAEEAKFIAGQGDLERALQVIAPHADTRDQVGYLAQLGAIYNTAGDFDRMLQVHKQLIEASNNSKEARIDLAWALARYTTRYEEAREIIVGIHPSACSEMYGRGLRIVQALLAQAAGRHGAAAVDLRKVHDELLPMMNPLVIGIRAELRGYLALSHKQMGNTSEADTLWQEVLILLEVHHCDLLIARYEGRA